MLIFIHISVISDVEHIFMYLLTICTSFFSLEKNVYLGILPFFTQVIIIIIIIILLLMCKFILYYKYQSFIGYTVYKYFPLSPRLTSFC